MSAFSRNITITSSHGQNPNTWEYIEILKFLDFKFYEIGSINPIESMPWSLIAIALCQQPFVSGITDLSITDHRSANLLIIAIGSNRKSQSAYRSAQDPNITCRPISDAISWRSLIEGPSAFALSPPFNISDVIFLYKALSPFLEEMPPFSKDKGSLPFVITSSSEVCFSPFKLHQIQSENIYAMRLFSGLTLDFHFPLWGTL